MTDMNEPVHITLDPRSGPAVVVWTGYDYTIFWDSSRGENYATMEMPPVVRAVTVARLREVANQLEDLSRVDVE